ncbi:serine/threonine-protein kinase [Colletotrichum musicola]|uniref:Serine/threonine-protein kinase n=1 Tax=Colletotrichum musicola TaxID=2175873 RepID=A0A8H6ITL0_9PEZI|nr:serine/threonine-protein kinase [Colletotrichum musicola]
MDVSSWYSVALAASFSLIILWRAAALGTINLLPAFIGRRIYTVRLLSTSVQLYHLIHGYNAAVGIVQASLYTSIVIRSAISFTIKNPHVFYSGLVPGMVAASVCAGLWAAIAIYPKVHAWLYGGGDVHVVVHLEGTSIVRVRPKKAIRVYPGCYYYVIASVFPLALDPPNIVYHWERVDSTVEAYPAPTEGSELHLLVQDMTALMGPAGKVFLDGPYGRNPHPEKYETVVLVAQGRGIAGVLPAALHIAQINRRSRITRRIDLQWKRDNNDSEDWAEESLQALIGLEPHRSLFAAHMYYPRLRVRPLKKLAIPEKHAKQWNTFRVSYDESMNRIWRNIDSKSRYAGHMLVMGNYVLSLVWKSANVYGSVR